jgi:RNA polymerase sigma-70 factor (ECF subfamily)
MDRWSQETERADKAAERAEKFDFKAELLDAVPALRAFARSLSGRADLADDLAQETLLRAWANRKSFTPGTNLKAWLFTILRNAFYSGLRKRIREVEDPDEVHARNIAMPPSQEEGVDLDDLQRALERLPAEQCEALILIGASGFSYEEAAAICGCAVGTMKSRVSRARRALLADLGGLPGGEDGTPRAGTEGAPDARRPSKKIDAA